jgi:hypothetical protein
MKLSSTSSRKARLGMPFIKSWLTTIVMKAAFEHDFIGKQKGKYEIKDVDTTAFEHFVQYLYTGYVSLRYHDWEDKRRFDEQDFDTEEHKLGCEAQAVHMGKLWIFADKYFLKALKNIINEHLKQSLKICSPMSLQAFKFIYKCTLGYDS